MGDPLSVAGSAVGIISFGLGVCDTIVKYSRAYRGYNEDFQTIKSKAESFHETLEIVDDAIKYAQKTLPKIAIILSKKVMRIEHLLQRLNDKIKRYGPDESRESLARKALKKSAYTFRKDDFREVAADLDSMQGDLQAALSTVSCIGIFQVSERMEVQMINPPRLTNRLCEDQEQLQLASTISSNTSTGSGYLIKQRKVSTTRKFRIYSHWLGRAIEIGFSISRSLKVQVVISPGCMAYDDIETLLDSFHGANYDDNLQLLKNSVLDRSFDLSCAIVREGSAVPLLDAVLGTIIRCYWYNGSSDYSFPIVGFLLDQSEGGVSSDIPDRNNIWVVPRLQEKDVPVIMRLINSGLNFDTDDLRWTCNTKPNLLLLFSKNESLIRMPEILRLICRESTADLRAALQEGRVSASEKIGNYSSLEWAFDWPEGVEILLEFGADPKQHFRSLVYPGAGRHSSAALLLKEGCFLSQAHLYKSVSCDDGGERLRLLVNELTARRKKLRKLAEDSLPWASISGYVGDKILDGQDCQKILGLLVEHKIPFPHPFTTQDKIEKFLMNSNGETVYHDLQNKQCAEALYLAGFLDADMLDSKGNSPLSTLAYYAYYSCSDFIEMIEWHMSKAADIHRRLPWANESVSHFLVSQIINYALFDRRDDHSSHKIKSENNLQSLITMSDVFFAPTRIPDRCNCPCSSNGCTALSVFLRELSASESWHCPQCVRGVFEKLEEWDQAYWKEPRAFIRSLTFNALDLNHTCFANTRKGYVYLRHLRPDNEDWINDNRDEQSALIEFEELVADLEQEFEKRSLPLKEFLSGPWYRRVKDHLLTRQPHEEQTIAGARSVGVELEFCGLSVPDWMEICIANKVEELSDEE